MLVTAFRKYMTSHGLWTLREGPKTPTKWFSETGNDWLYQTTVIGARDALASENRVIYCISAWLHKVIGYRFIQQRLTQIMKDQFRSVGVSRFIQFDPQNQNPSNHLTGWTSAFQTSENIFPLENIHGSWLVACDRYIETMLHSTRGAGGI